jgi:hypothetical protein
MSHFSVWLPASVAVATAALFLADRPQPWPEPKGDQPFFTSPIPKPVTVRTRISEAVRDPFVSASAPPPQALTQSPPALPKAAPTPVVAESAPPLNVRFEGRMTSPSGAHLVFASYAGSSVVLAAGQALPNGYIVKSLTDQAVEFVYPALGTTARLDLPVSPNQEVR